MDHTAVHGACNDMWQLLSSGAVRRGLRCLFGDQTLFCRAADFYSVGGFAERLPIMEDADLCLRLHLAGPAAYAAHRKRRCQSLVDVSC